MSSKAISAKKALSPRRVVAVKCFWIAYKPRRKFSIYSKKFSALRRGFHSISSLISIATQALRCFCR